MLLTTVATNARDHLDNATPGDADATERDAPLPESTVDKVSADHSVEDARAKEGAIKTEGGCTSETFSFERGDQRLQPRPSRRRSWRPCDP